MDEEKRYYEKRDQIEELLGYDKEVQRYFSAEREMELRQAVEVLKGHLDTLVEGNTVVVSDRDKEIVLKGTTVLMDRALDSGISDWLRDFGTVFSIICRNWNDNTLKDGEIYRRTAAVRRLLDSSRALNDSIALVDRLKRRVEQLESHRNGSLELSRHYLKKLKEDG